jgi:hypothetical protein
MEIGQKCGSQGFADGTILLIRSESLCATRIIEFVFKAIMA